jgi:hypothetical protein
MGVACTRGGLHVVLDCHYQMADFYISPSHVDGSSVFLMDTLTCGLPCLVSDISANKEWVQEGYNGWLFPDGDHNALWPQRYSRPSSTAKINRDRSKGPRYCRRKSGLTQKCANFAWRLR